MGSAPSTPAKASPRAPPPEQQSSPAAARTAPPTAGAPQLDGAPSPRGYSPAAAPRPPGAVGTFLRVVTINDCYTLDFYPHVATAIQIAKEAAPQLDCVISSHLNGDFLSPCTLTAIDGGKGMMQALNVMGVDYICLGNHEFDLGFQPLADKLSTFKGTTINSNCVNKEFTHLPSHVRLKVGAERVAVLAGFATEDLSCYRPASRPDITSVNKGCASVWEEAKAAEGGRTPDLFLPMTHQLIVEDRATCAVIAKHPELGSRTPIVLGGHEHDVFIDSAGASIIIKTGQDAARIGIVDIWWDADGMLHSSVALVPACVFPPHQAMLQYCEDQKAMLKNLMSMPLFTLPRPMSSVRVRFEESDLASYLLGFVKRALRSEGVEIAVMQGGAIRGCAEYQAGDFEMGNLFNEFAFDCELAIVDLPGSVIQASIKETREAPKPAPHFLHFDTDAKMNAACEFEIINNQPFEPDKLYKVAIYQFLLTGLNNIEPLMNYVSSSGMVVPDAEGCPQGKNLVISVCMKDAWRELVGLSEEACHKSTAAEINSSLDEHFKEVAYNSDIDPTSKRGAAVGALQIDQQHLVKFVEKKGMRKNSVMLAEMIKSLDVDHDGMINRKDFEYLIH